jgi:hypothetical protein
VGVRRRRLVQLPVAGNAALTVSLAVGGSVVSIRVEGDIDPILAARIETLFDLL